MPTKKATSSRTPAAARKSAPQPRRTAAQSQQPRESRGPSPTVVSRPGASFQAAEPKVTGLAALNLRYDWPTGNLLKPYAAGDVRQMPFVVDRKKAGKAKSERIFWAPEEGFPGESPSVRGMFCAGAYLQYTLNEGPGWMAPIVAAMPQPFTETEIHFFTTVEKYVHQAVGDYPSIGRHIEALAKHLRTFEAQLDRQKDGDVLRRLATALNTTVVRLYTDDDKAE